jgi:PP-loop superfamily ATP-utilizing enzyme
MAQKIPGSEIILLAADRAGDEDKVRAILADWGMEEAAIRRMLAEQGARKTWQHAESPCLVRKTSRTSMNSTDARAPGRHA